MVEPLASDKDVEINEINLNSESSAVAVATSVGFMIHEFEPKRLRANHLFEGGFAHIALAKKSALVILVPTGNNSTWT